MRVLMLNMQSKICLELASNRKFYRILNLYQSKKDFSHSKFVNLKKTKNFWSQRFLLRSNFLNITSSIMTKVDKFRQILMVMNCKFQSYRHWTWLTLDLRLFALCYPRVWELQLVPWPWAVEANYQPTAAGVELWSSIPLDYGDLVFFVAKSVLKIFVNLFSTFFLEIGQSDT